MREVDIVLERDDGMIAGIEVKAIATVKAGDFAGPRALSEACSKRFAFGVVLYDGTDVVPFGNRLAAAQLSYPVDGGAMRRHGKRMGLERRFERDIIVGRQPMGETAVNNSAIGNIGGIN